MVSELTLTPPGDGFPTGREEQHEPAPSGASLEEALWVRQARAGDSAAFDCIVMQYEGRLLRFLTGVVGDVEVARELCQDTFLAAYQALPRGQGEMHLSAWLHTIALNKARSHHRRKKFKRFLPIEDHDLPSGEPDMQETTATQEMVQQVLRRLPRQYSEVLLLQLVSELSCREIAETLNCSEGAIKVRLMRARDAFRRAYAQHGGEPCNP